MVNVQVIGDKALIAKFEASLKAMDAGKPLMLRKSGMAIQMSIRDTIWKVFNQRTGALFNSVRLFYQTKNGISIGTGKGLDYAEPLELGAIAHEITGNSLLSFWWEKAGMFFVGPKVQHPGNIAYRYVYGGTLRSMPQVYRYCCDMVAVAFGISVK
jgi:hypothetical protein